MAESFIHQNIIESSPVPSISWAAGAGKQENGEIPALWKPGERSLGADPRTAPKGNIEEAASGEAQPHGGDIGPRQVEGKAGRSLTVMAACLGVMAKSPSGCVRKWGARVLKSLERRAGKLLLACPPGHSSSAGRSDVAEP